MENSKALIYLHGKGGSAKEAERFKFLLPTFDVYGLEPEEFTPWGSRQCILSSFEKLEREYKDVYLLSNSIGTYFSLLALGKAKLKKALFLSPVLDMERMIYNLMSWSGVTEERLKEERIIHTSFDEDLSWDYLTYVRQHPIEWQTETAILYAKGDRLIERDTIDAFVSSQGASLTVMEEGGEHWFHTPEQLAFLDSWLKKELGVEQ